MRPLDDGPTIVAHTYIGPRGKRALFPNGSSAEHCRSQSAPFLIAVAVGSCQQKTVVTISPRGDVVHSVLLVLITRKNLHHQWVGCRR